MYKLEAPDHYGIDKGQIELLIGSVCFPALSGLFVIFKETFCFLSNCYAFTSISLLKAIYLQVIFI